MSASLRFEPRYRPRHRVHRPAVSRVLTAVGSRAGRRSKRDPEGEQGAAKEDFMTHSRPAMPPARRVLTRRATIGLVLAVLLSFLFLGNVRPVAAAGPCGPPVVSVIACENTLPG